MKRKSYTHNHINSWFFSDLDNRVSKKSYNNSTFNFWDYDDGLKKSRRHYVLRMLRNLSAKKCKSRFLMTNVFLFRLCSFSIKNKKHTSIFRKYVSNYGFYSLVSSNALRSSNLMLQKSIFYNFLENKGAFYSWYSAFSKKVFFFKKNTYKQPCVYLRKGCDLFIFGNFEESLGDELNFWFSRKNFNLFDNKLNDKPNIFLFFDLSVQHIIEIYKINQLLFLTNIN